jgi:NAD(P)-dependent dehydrogenase (short-subunit alcohol dehydrogenase family)
MTTGDESPIPDYLSMLRLDGRSYVVAGAGVGMGRHTTHALAQAGARKIVCVDIEASRADEIADEVGREVAIPWVGDVTTREGAAALGVFAEQELGTIDGFVDIIGMAKWESILDMSDETFDWEIDMNLRHAFLLSQELGRRMITTGGGTMVFIASVSGLTSGPMHAAYGAAKAGLMAWVQTLSEELGGHNIRPNAVAPGTILSPRMDAVFNDDQRRANAENVPLGRMGATSDIASAALFLTSDLSGYISGRTIVVDGGVDAKFPYPTTL